MLGSNNPETEHPVYLSKRPLCHMAGFSDSIPQAVKTNKILKVKKSVEIRLPKLKRKFGQEKIDQAEAMPKLEKGTAWKNAETLPEISAPNSPKLN